MVSRKKQLKRLKKDAQRLWSDQQDLLNRANGVARDAVPHAQYFAKEKVVPGAKTIYDERLKSTVDKGTAAGALAGKYVSSTAKDAVLGTIVPAFSSAGAAALLLAEEAGSRISGSADDVAKKSKVAGAVLTGVTKKGQKSEKKSRAKLKAAGKAAKAAAGVAAARAAKATGKKKGIGVGGVIGIAVLGAIVAHGRAVTAGVSDAYWTGAAMTALMALVALAAIHRRR